MGTDSKGTDSKSTDSKGTAAKANKKPEATDFFWDLAEPFLARSDVDEGSLMGFPCVRVGGDFFSTCDHRTGHLIVKLDRDRVADLITEGIGEPFAPAGKVFKEWMLVERRDEAEWVALMDEAYEFVKGKS